MEDDNSLNICNWGTSEEFMEHPAVKLMAVISERDAAILERDTAIAEKKAAYIERDVALLQRDMAIADRNAALLDRDAAMAALDYTRDINSVSQRSSTSGMLVGTKLFHMLSESPLTGKKYHSDQSVSLAFPAHVSKLLPEKQPNQKEQTYDKKGQKDSPSNKSYNDSESGTPTSKTPRKKGAKTGQESDGQLAIVKHEQKDQEYSNDKITNDNSTIPIPVCSCTGVPRQCYRWGSGGWQSVCCNTSTSMYPLPLNPNKQGTRVGGRKMSGGAFGKLLERLVADGHNLACPIDLKDHWAKHGTNRYVRIR